MHLKDLGHHANPRHWSGFVWSIVLAVLVASIGTAYVGVKLYQVTDREVGFNTH